MKKIILLIFLLILNSCFGQKNNNNLNNNKMEYFDESKYKNLPINPDTGYRIMENGDEVQYIESSPTHYVLWIYLKNSPYQYYKVFFFKNKQLKYIDKKFYKNNIGIGRDYNESGKLIKETNYDLPYKFTIEQLCELIQKNYDIDLMKTIDYSKDRLDYDCSRYENIEVYKKDFRPVYNVRFIVRVGEKGNARKEVTIDGTTGKILYETIYNYEQGGDELPKSKIPVEVRDDSEKKNLVGLGHVDDNDDSGKDNDNNNPNGMISILILILGLVIISGILIYKYKELHPVTP